MKEKKPKLRGIHWYDVEFVLKLLAAPAFLIGLFVVVGMLDEGITPNRLIIVGACALAVIIGVLAEQYSAKIGSWMERRKSGAEAKPQPAPVRENPVVHAAPAVPPVRSAASNPPAGAAWQIQWRSGALDDILLVYERAEADPLAVKLFASLETDALREARQHCGLIRLDDDHAMTREEYDALPEARREAVIARLGESGISDLSLDVQGAKISVTLAPIVPNITACTIFNLLNRLEKLDGSLDQVAQGKVTLALQVPLGGKKGLMMAEMLIVKLYPWLNVRETASNTLAVTL